MRYKKPNNFFGGPAQARVDRTCVRRSTQEKSCDLPKKNTATDPLDHLFLLESLDVDVGNQPRGIPEPDENKYCIRLCFLLELMINVTTIVCSSTLLVAQKDILLSKCILVLCTF